MPFEESHSEDTPLVQSPQSNDQPFSRHLLCLSPDPSPSISPIDSNSSSSSLSTSPSTTTSYTDQQISENSYQFEDLYRNRRTSDLNTSNLYQLMKSETNRLRSYYIRDNSRWNLPFIRPEDLAKAGLFFLNDDRVQCAFCKGVIGNWSPGDRPLEEHARHFPFCPFIMEEDVGNIPIGSDPLRSPLPVLGHDVCGNRDPFEETVNQLVNTNARQNPQPIDMESFGIQPYSGPSDPDMGPIEARKKSYEDKGWDNSVPVSVDKLAEAGFYYIGYKDAVKCFHCNGGLTDWIEGDDPWVEHAKKFPKCHFLKLNKSQSFIDKCVELEQNGIQSNDEDINSSDNEITICKLVDQWMKSSIVQQLISMNEFPIDLIKATLNRRYYNCRKPFESFADLYEALRESDHNYGNRVHMNQMSLSEPQSGQNNATNSMSCSTRHSMPKLTDICNEVINRQPDESNENRLLCKICLYNEIGVVFLPCGHQLACSECAQRLTNCPICRQLIRGYVRTFFS